MESNTKEALKKFLYNVLMVFFGLIITIMVISISVMAAIVLGPFGGVFTLVMCLALMLTVMHYCAKEW